MNLTKKQLTKLKTKLALEGTGAKGRLAEQLDLHSSQITLLLNTGYCPDHASDSLNLLIKHAVK